MAEQTPSTQTYSALLASIKERIQAAQVRAALAVNQELVVLYWGIGKEILARQQEEGWGKNIIPRLAKDLKSQFPDMKGLSPRNLGYMKAFAEALARRLNFAASCCKIAVVPQLHHSRQDKGSRGTPLVRSSRHRVWLESKHSRYANRQQPSPTPREGHHQLSDHASKAAI